MVFVSDKQRKAVMAKLNQGGTRSDVSPRLIGKSKIISRLGFTREERNVLDRTNLVFDSANKQFSLPFGKAKDTGLTETQFVMFSLGLSKPKANKLIIRYLNELDAGKIKRKELRGVKL